MHHYIKLVNCICQICGHTAIFVLCSVSMTRWLLLCEDVTGLPKIYVFFIFCKKYKQEWNNFCHANSTSTGLWYTCTHSTKAVIVLLLYHFKSMSRGYLLMASIHITQGGIFQEKWLTLLNARQYQAIAIYSITDFKVYSQHIWSSKREKFDYPCLNHLDLTWTKHSHLPFSHNFWNFAFIIQRKHIIFHHFIVIWYIFLLSFPSSNFVSQF